MVYYSSAMWRVSRFRREQLRVGKHYKDSAATNQKQFDDWVVRLDKIFKYKVVNQHLPWLSNVCEFLFGVRAEFANHCEYCVQNKGKHFFVFNDNSRRSCYSCKLNHVSMFTEKQCLKHYSHIEKIKPNVFEKLKHYGRVYIESHGRKWRVNVYFSKEDLDAEYFAAFGFVPQSCLLKVYGIDNGPKKTKQIYKGRRMLKQKKR